MFDQMISDHIWNSYETSEAPPGQQKADSAPDAGGRVDGDHQPARRVVRDEQQRDEPRVQILLAQLHIIIFEKHSWNFYYLSYILRMITLIRLGLLQVAVQILE